MPVDGPPMSNTLSGIKIALYSAKLSNTQRTPTAITNGIFVPQITVMDAKTNPEDFYAKLKIQLADTSIWPTAYLYKFIVPTDKAKVAQIEEIFDNMGAVIETKESRTGKYTSISINIRMKNPDAVIEKYKEVGQIEGVISL